MNAKFVKNIVIDFRMVLKTGMHIGGSEEKTGIGGADSSVITEYINYHHGNGKSGRQLEVPIIPGSTIKGKMRSLLEYERYGSDYVLGGTGVAKMISCEKDPDGIISLMFGCAREGDGKTVEFPKTRLIFRDAFPTDHWIQTIAENEMLRSGREVKGENTINRVTGQATPRFIERVIPGVEFNCSIVLTVYESDRDKEKDMVSTLKKGLKMLEDSYIGGHGSRGYGRIRIPEESIKVVKKTAQDYAEQGERMFSTQGL